MTFIRPFMMLLFTLLVTACGITAQPQNQHKKSHKPLSQPLPQLYLKGTMTQWAIDKSYKMEKVQRSLYSASANLQQGKTVEFMFSAKDASTLRGNCGYRHIKDQQLTADKKVKASCKQIVLQNFVFTPKQSGVFEFFIDFERLGVPLVFVHKVF